MPHTFSSENNITFFSLSSPSSEKLQSCCDDNVITFPTGNKETLYNSQNCCLHAVLCTTVVVVSVSYEGLEGGSLFYNIL